MASLSQTITNTMGVRGVSPATLWGVGVWGTSLWGVDEDVETHTEKGITEIVGFNDLIAKDVQFTIVNTVAMSSAITPITREWGIWDYIFTVPSSDGADQVLDEFDKVADNSTNYSPVTTDETEWT